MSSLTYISSFVLAKLSFAVFYLRVIPTRGFRRLNFVIIGLLVAQGIEETFVVIFSCTPVYKYWTPAAEGTCLNLLNFYYISVSWHLCVDWFPLSFDCLLTPSVRRQTLDGLDPLPRAAPDAQKPQAAVGQAYRSYGHVLTRSPVSCKTYKSPRSLRSLANSSSACIISIIRCTYLNDTSSDVTWRLVDPSNWTSAEVCSLIICACIPYVRNLLAEIPRVNEALGLSSSGGSKSGGYGTGGISGGYGRGTNGGGTSFALQSRTPYIQQQQARLAGEGVSSANATSGSGKNGSNGHTLRGTESTEEIFPNYRDKSGGIVVSTDVKVAVERHSIQDSFGGSS